MKFVSLLLLCAALFGCGAPETPQVVPAPVAEVPQEQPQSEARPPRVVMYSGYGVWAADVLDIKYHLDQMGIPADVVSSLKGVNYELYSAFIMPGGNAVKEGSGIGSAERDRLKKAILGGLNYLGHCAGAFFVGSWSSYYLKLIPQKLDYNRLYYSGKEMVMDLNTMMDGSKRDILYYGGPDLTPVTGKVLAKYSTGETSMVQFTAGMGLVVLTGGHPESSQITINALGLRDSDGYDDVIERPLIKAVVNGKGL